MKMEIFENNVFRLNLRSPNNNSLFSLSHSIVISFFFVKPGPHIEPENAALHSLIVYNNCNSGEWTGIGNNYEE